MPNAPDPKFTPLPDGRVAVRSQVRYRRLPESAQVIAAMRSSGEAQVLWDRDDDYVISWPSSLDGRGIVEISHMGLVSQELIESHKASVSGFAAVFETSHGPAEIVNQSDLEQAPERAKWVRVVDE